MVVYCYPHHHHHHYRMPYPVRGCRQRLGHTLVDRSLPWPRSYRSVLTWSYMPCNRRLDLSAGVFGVESDFVNWWAVCGWKHVLGPIFRLWIRDPPFIVVSAASNYRPRSKFATRDIGTSKMRVVSERRRAFLAPSPCVCFLGRVRAPARRPP